MVTKRFGLTEGEADGVLEHLIRGGDLSAYGVHSAITRYSQDVEDYGRASELEVLGGDVIALPKEAWREVATAI